LIYLVIIALWAAVLIPMWLRRHDQISEVRSTARFSSAMRSLGSHDQPHYALEMSGGPAYAFSSPANEPFEEVPMARPTQRRMPQDDRRREADLRREEAHRRAATRRAIVLGLLTGFVLVTLVAAMLGMAPKWAPLLAALPVIAFIVAAALTASERSTARSTARSTERLDEAQQRPARRPTAEIADEAPVAVEQSEEEWENWNAWDDDNSWEAVPTTLPTYVGAPRASAVPRGIDRDTPGEWTGSAMVEQAQAMRARRSSEPLADASEIDHYAQTAEIPIVTEDYDARRAVNE
jgi:hypothetical protein